MNRISGSPRLRRTLSIHRLVQLFLVLLLVVTALHFQQLLAGQGRASAFLNSVLVTLLLQAALFLPIRRFAAAEARRELAEQADPPTPAETADRRRQRLVSDLLKVSLFCFFLVFVLLAPPATTLLCTVFFCFVGSLLTFLQCYAQAARQGMAA